MMRVWGGKSKGLQVSKATKDKKHRVVTGCTEHSLSILHLRVLLCAWSVDYDSVCWLVQCGLRLE